MLLLLLIFGETSAAAVGADDGGDGVAVRLTAADASDGDDGCWNALLPMPIRLN